MSRAGLHIHCRFNCLHIVQSGTKVMTENVIRNCTQWTPQTSSKTARCSVKVVNSICHTKCKKAKYVTKTKITSKP